MKRGIVYLNCAANPKQYRDQIISAHTGISADYCEQNGIHLMNVFSETSLKELYERKVFKEVLQFINEHHMKIDFLIVWDYSRLTRSYKEYQSLLKILDQYEIRIVQLRPNYYWEEYGDFIDDSNREFNQVINYE